MKRIFLSAIVKNESARIERFLNSLLGHIDGAVIVDTGSTDDTVKLATNLLNKAGVWCSIQTGAFHNFEQARNLALSYVQGESLARRGSFDYIMLVDADMELVVTDPAAFDDLADPVYHILQISGDLRYYNTRLIRRDVDAVYRGVTHEYLDVGEHSVTRLEGAHFLDHADGANRGNKLQRDEALLREDLKTNPDNARSVYYLARTLQEMRRIREAADLFRLRAAMGGWWEECWHSKLCQARCLRALEEDASR